MAANNLRFSRILRKYDFLIHLSYLNLQNYFLQYSDKFEYPKGSDLLLAFIFVFFIFLNRKQFSKNSLISFSMCFIFQ